MSLSNNLLGLIIAPVIAGAVLGVSGFFLGQAFAPPVPPIAAISPATILVAAGESVEFNASGSVSSSGAITNYVWKVGGHPADQSSVGLCQTGTNTAIATCRFQLPGTFSVSVDIQDATGQTSTAVSPVTVSLKDGYIGVVLLSGQNRLITDQAYRVILAAVNWQDIQRSVSRPIVIFDPDKQQPVYAASRVYVEGELDQLDTTVFQGAKVMIPPFAPAVRNVIRSTLEELGSVVIVLPSTSMESSIETGLAGSGMFNFASPQDYVAEILE